MVSLKCPLKFLLVGSSSRIWSIMISALYTIPLMIDPHVRFFIFWQLFQIPVSFPHFFLLSQIKKDLHYLILDSVHTELSAFPWRRCPLNPIILWFLRLFLTLSFWDIDAGTCCIFAWRINDTLYLEPTFFLIFPWLLYSQREINR